MARLKEYYKDTVVKELTKQFSYKNPMQVPKITKVVLNIGSGEFGDKKQLVFEGTSALLHSLTQSPTIPALTSSSSSTVVLSVRANCRAT